MVAILLLHTGCNPTDAPIAEAISVDEGTAQSPANRYVGSQVCGSCHQQVYELWRGSHHAHAIQIADEGSISAPLDPATGSPRLITTAEGIAFEAAEEPQRLRVSHTFGIEPLQQYLVPTERGRLQALRWAWDSRAGSAGGQRWFKLYPDEDIPPGDILHWRSMSQNWNTMCADCHSTAVQKNYEVTQDAYDTQFAELTVGCEACHGPGSQHAAQPEHPLPTVDSLTESTQPEICAPCHSRRSQLQEGFDGTQPLLDHYLPALLNPPLYHADGQILDEVYVYGSFLSSRMHTRGVVCSNCHEPHSTDLRITGNGVCTQCHSKAGNPDFPTLKRQDYASANHHLHAEQAPGSFCIDCHMPSRTYMVVDDRHDHSFRVPRPDLAEAFDTPSPCKHCHEDKTHAWAAEVLRRKFGEPKAGHFSETLVHNATTAGGETRLSKLAIDINQPAIARATAVQRLGSGTRNASSRAVRQATTDISPLVRYAALASIGRLNTTMQHAALQRGLTDPVAAIRMEAARQVHSLLAPAQLKSFSPALASATQEYVASQMYNADRPEAHVNLAALRRQQGHAEQAQTHLAHALQLNPQFVPAHINLADLLRSQGLEEQAFEHLERAVRIQPLVPEAGYALAMWHVRARNYDKAVDVLQRTHEVAPANTEVNYAYALALNTAGRPEQALALLQTLTVDPATPESLLFLQTTIARDQDQLSTAIASAQRLLDLAPHNPTYQALHRQLQSMSNAPTSAP